MSFGYFRHEMEEWQNLFSNQLRVYDFDDKAQERLRSSRVSIVGAGGLGTPALYLLAAMGVGKIRVIDHDTIDAGNLNRQSFYGVKDIGRPKVQIAVSKLKEQLPSVALEYHEERLNQKNANELLENSNLVLDCSDNLVARYAIDKTCQNLSIPFVFGGVRVYDGQVGLFNHEKGISFHQMYPPVEENFANEDCNSLGTFGFVCHLVASLQVSIAYQVLTNKLEIQEGEIFSLSLKDFATHRIRPK